MGLLLNSVNRCETISIFREKHGAEAFGLGLVEPKGQAIVTPPGTSSVRSAAMILRLQYYVIRNRLIYNDPIIQK